jgi:hypothetical protein
MHMHLHGGGGTPPKSYLGGPPTLIPSALSDKNTKTSSIGEHLPILAATSGFPFLPTGTNDYGIGSSV